MIDDKTDGQTNGQIDTQPEESKKNKEQPQIDQEEAEPVQVDQMIALMEESKTLKEQLLRTSADFENYRKRTARDVEDVRFQTKEKLLREFLPVLDNLDRALFASETSKESTNSALLEGVKMVQKQFLQALEKSDIKPIDALGKIFDPQLHEAIQQVLHADLPSGTISSVLQRGYMSGTRLLRPALVVVVKN